MPNHTHIRLITEATSITKLTYSKAAMYHTLGKEEKFLHLNSNQITQKTYLFSVYPW